MKIGDWVTVDIEAVTLDSIDVVETIEVHGPLWRITKKTTMFSDNGAEVRAWDCQPFTSTNPRDAYTFFPEELKLYTEAPKENPTNASE